MAAFPASLQRPVYSNDSGRGNGFHGLNPDMDALTDIPRYLAAKRRASASGPAEFLAERAADELEFRLSLVKRRFESPVSLFGFSGHASDAMTASGTCAQPLRVEADAAFLKGGPGALAPFGSVPLAPQSADLIIALLNLHAVDDLPGFLHQVRQSLRPDGLFLAAIPSAGTLAELRESLLAAEAESGSAHARVLPFMDLRDAGALLQRAGFALPVADQETVVVRYRTLRSLMADLRAMGESSSLASRPRGMASRSLFEKAESHYRTHFADADGKMRATFNWVWLSGWAPHESQQKPKARGSATHSLKSALEGL